MNCKVKDKKILWGSVLIENSTDASFAIKEVSLLGGKSVAPAMTQEEIKKALGGGGLVEKLLSLTDLVKSSMAASNIEGQEVPPKQKGYFTASFLIPKKNLDDIARNAVFHGVTKRSEEIL